MKAKTVRERVNEIVAEELGVLPEKITDGAHLTDDLGADSLDMVFLVMAVEEDFCIDITDAEAAAAETVGALVALVERKVGAP